MISISKNHKAPNLLSEYRRKIISTREDRQTLSKDYYGFCDDSPSGKEQVQKFLLTEQHKLCCYCMKKISEDDIVIEHFKPKHKYGHLSLTYSNLLGSCKGNLGGVKHCDSSKLGIELRILPNPSDRGIPFSQFIDYSSYGEIKLKDAYLMMLNEQDKTSYLVDINQTLNLNNDELLSARKTKLNKVINLFKSQKQRKSTLTIGDFFKGKKVEYHGFIENMLFKKFSKK